MNTSGDRFIGAPPTPKSSSRRRIHPSTRSRSAPSSRQRLRKKLNPNLPIHTYYSLDALRPLSKFIRRGVALPSGPPARRRRFEIAVPPPPRPTFAMDDEPFVYTAGVVVPSDVTSLVIGGSVTIVPPRTFENCQILERVELQEGVEEIGAFAFARCPNLACVDCQASSLRTIGHQAFALCKRLLEVILEEGLRQIGGWAFKGCDLRRITVPSSVVAIGPRAFYGCARLSEATLAGGMVMVARGAFRRCPCLERVSIFSTAIVITNGVFGWSCDGRVVAVTGEIERDPANEPARLVLASPHLASMHPGDLTDLTNAIERIMDATRGSGRLDLAVGDVSGRIRDCFVDRLSTWYRREVATVLELALWKMELDRSRRRGADILTRDDCRRTCGADPVVELVLSSLAGPHRRIPRPSREEDEERLALRNDAKNDWVDTLRGISPLMVVLSAFLLMAQHWFKRYFLHGQ